MVQVLVVEDDRIVADMIRQALQGEGYLVEVAPTLFRARGLVERIHPRLIILDRKLPDGDGLEFCREVRAKEEGRDVPVLFLTVKKSVADKVVGLKFGADDYLAKPFAPEELLARAEALLRRGQTAPQPNPVLRFGDLEVNSGSRRARLRGRELDLAPKEFDLLWTFLRRKNRVLSREFLLNEVWGYERAVEVSFKTVDKTVSRLREVLGSYGSKIEAVPKYGYRFSDGGD